MLNHSVFKLLAATLVVGSATAQTNCGSDCSLYTLTFDDEFDGTSVDETTWNYRLDNKDLSLQTENNVVVSGGYANILLKKQVDIAPGVNYTGGGLISKPNFHYGYFETRMMMNTGAGWHSSFWHMAGNGSTTYNTASPDWTEIDTFEVDSAGPYTIRSNIFDWWSGNPNTNYHELTSNEQTGSLDFAADYYVFGTIWNETAVTTFINGTQFWSSLYHPTSWPHNFVNIWASTIGTYEINDSALPSQSSVDYIRYYQKDYYLTANSLCWALDQGTTACASNEGYSETGTWGQSALDGYTLALKSRYSCSTAGSTASWTQQVPVAGGYQVAAWVVSPDDSDPKAVYTVALNGSVVQTVTVDQSVGGTNSNPDNTGLWVTLVGTVDVTEGDTITVQVTASGTGCTRSDTVKLVRIS